MAVKPKLALIPSGVKASKVYSVLPSDGVGDFDFSRSGSATRINKDGLIETVASNVPRLNYPLIDGVVSGCPSLLLEPESRNLVTYSEDFTDASWSSSTATITANQGISLSGDLSADEITTTDANGSIGGVLSISNDALTRTQSVFVKYISGTSQFMLRGVYLNGTSVAKFSKFDLSNGTIISTDTTAKIEDYGNGWYRVSQQITNNNTGNATFVFQIFTTNDTISTNNLLLWGAQLEAGSYPTSYIPTTGSQTTRSAETCNNAGDVNTFNDSEGVLMAEISALVEDAGTERYVYIGNGTTANRVVIRYSTTENDIRMLVTSGGSTQVSSGTTNYNITENHKIALKYKANDFALWIDGVEVLTDTNGSTPTGINQLTLSYSGTQFYGNTKQIKYFDKALTDTDLEELTSWTSFNEMATAQLYTIL